MPVRSLSLSVFRWPDARTVEEAVRLWAEKVAAARPEVLHVGYFGSYARGDWGVGSDLDLIMIVEDSPLPFTRRAAEWDVTDLPVPADLLVYTLDEWELLKRRKGRFYQTVMREAVWIYRREYVRS
ncbi:MAG: nucleotidyltransferase domain-containing protein [Bacillota bacterium]